jgi:hypothetical protein
VLSGSGRNNGRGDYRGRRSLKYHHFGYSRRSFRRAWCTVVKPAVRPIVAPSAWD